MYDVIYKHKILECLQLNEMNLEASEEFLQQLELIDLFTFSKNYVEVCSATKSLIKYKYCDKRHERDINKCLTQGKLCLNCKRKDHFQSVCRYKKKYKKGRKNKSPTLKILDYIL